jgi:ABC-type multidrug transport system fused ATPase/permease subunit
MINQKNTFFLKDNKLIITIYTILTLIILPLEAIGYSSHTTNIITSVKNGNNNNSVITKSIMYIFLIFATTISFRMIRDYINIKISNNLVYFIRTNIFKDILNKYKNSNGQLEKGKLMTYLNIIPDVYEDQINFLLSKILPNIAVIIILTIYFLYVDLKLGMIMICMIIILILSILQLSKKCIKLQIEKQKLYYSNNENIQDKLSNIFSIVTSNNNSKEQQNNIDIEKKYKQKVYDANLQNINTNNILIFILLFFILFILIYFIILFRKNTHKKLITGFLLFFSYINYIHITKWYVLEYLNKQSLIDQYNKSLNSSSSVKDGDMENFISNGIIEFKNVDFYYNKTQILSNINIKFKKDKLNVLMGESGSGKTTIFKLILRLNEPSNGDIYIDNVNIKKSKIEYLRNNIGIVNQNVQLFNNTIYENIIYKNNIDKQTVLNLINNFKLDKNIFKNLTLDSFVGVDGQNLSNGQRQMVLILREYLNDKKIILMDEPTSALDINSKILIINILKKMTKKKIIIISSHDSYVKEQADYIYIIKK